MACVVLIVEPANGRVLVLMAGLAAMLVINLVLMRRAFAPLARLTAVMARVDPLRPGERVTIPGPDSEVTVLAHAFNDMLDRLESERRDSARRAASAQEAERRRLAGELHDEIGQSLTAMALQLDRLAQHSPDATRGAALEARDGALRLVDDVRALARQLRPEALDTLGLVPALTNLVERLSSQTGLRIERDLRRDLPALHPDTELVVYRVAQESLTNVVRHAAAGTARIALAGDGGGVVLKVRDDGSGYDPDGLEEGGIRFMRERAVLIGGDLQVASRSDGAGTDVRLWVPSTQDGGHLR